jgi:hypothetical protein
LENNIPHFGHGHPVTTVYLSEDTHRQDSNRRSRRIPFITLEFFMNNFETINKLLKDELSATETYQLALDKETSLCESKQLQPIHAAHKDAASSLQALILRLGGDPCEDSGAWGAWAKIVQGSAILLGKTAALKVLQEGEKIGTEDYEKALQDTELCSDARVLIETKLLPAQHAHSRTLDMLLETESV